LDLVEELIAIASDAGVSIPQLAMAFAITHPAVSSAIIGPRTLTHLEDLLAGADIELSDEVLDRIDALVAPGAIVDQRDLGYSPPSLTDQRLRRRPVGDRSAE
jgi:aryl-alcohol dehydrogenase-like predicted oxidoreductase